MDQQIFMMLRGVISRLQQTNVIAFDKACLGIFLITLSMCLRNKFQAASGSYE